MPYGGIRTAVAAAEAYGFKVSQETQDIFRKHRKTHNDGVFDDKSGFSVSTSFADTGTYFIGLQIVTSTDSIKVYKKIRFSRLLIGFFFISL